MCRDNARGLGDGKSSTPSSRIFWGWFNQYLESKRLIKTFVILNVREGLFSSPFKFCRELSQRHRLQILCSFPALLHKFRSVKGQKENRHGYDGSLINVQKYNYYRSRSYRTSWSRNYFVPLRKNQGM